MSCFTPKCVWRLCKFEIVKVLVNVRFVALAHCNSSFSSIFERIFFPQLLLCFCICSLSNFFFVPACWEVKLAHNNNGSAKKNTQNRFFLRAHFQFSKLRVFFVCVWYISCMFVFSFYALTVAELSLIQRKKKDKKRSHVFNTNSMRIKMK